MTTTQFISGRRVPIWMETHSTWHYSKLGKNNYFRDKIKRKRKDKDISMGDSKMELTLNLNWNNFKSAVLLYYTETIIRSIISLAKLKEKKKENNLLATRNQNRDLKFHSELLNRTHCYITWE